MAAETPRHRTGFAHDVYDVLVDEVGADPSARVRDVFVRTVSEWLAPGGPAAREYRFRGSVGWGGKVVFGGHEEDVAYVAVVGYPAEQRVHGEAIRRANNRLSEVVAAHAPA